MKKLLFIFILFCSCKKADLPLEGLYMQKNTDVYGKHVHIMTIENGIYFSEAYYIIKGEFEQGKPVGLKPPDETGVLRNRRIRVDGNNFDWGKNIKLTDNGFSVYLIFNKMTVNYIKVTRDQCLAELVLK